MQAMHKRTHKFRAMSDVAAVVAAAPSLSEAAVRLGVNRSTLHRWMESGKIPKKGVPPAGERVTAPSAGQSPEEWAESVRCQREMTETDQQLLVLATMALTTARDVSERAPSRLAAMGRFQLLIRQMDERTAAATLPAPKPQQRHAPARPSSDPRSILVAVK
jgi:hypothetical protein